MPASGNRILSGFEISTTWRPMVIVSAMSGILTHWLRRIVVGLWALCSRGTRLGRLEIDEDGCPRRREIIVGPVGLDGNLPAVLPHHNHACSLVEYIPVTG